jgi:hypothetical protein
VGGGDFALRATDDRGGLHAVGPPEPGQRHHDGEEHALDDVDSFQGRCVEGVTATVGRER